MGAYDLIIFDCDGTLVDSEYLNNKVTSDLLTGYGFPQYTTEHLIEAFAGLSMSDVKRIVEAETGTILPPSFLTDYMVRVNDEVPSLLKQIDGVVDTIDRLRHDIRICVGSNGERSNVLRSIKYAGLGPYFPDDVVFTKDMVAHAKPAPDLFLLAAEKMGAAPERTLVIEDSITGAKAGKAAGMTVIGLTATFHDSDRQAGALLAAGAHHIAGHFSEIMGFI